MSHLKFGSPTTSRILQITSTVVVLVGLTLAACSQPGVPNPNPTQPGTATPIPETTPNPAPLPSTTVSTPSDLKATAGNAQVILDWADNATTDLKRYTVHYGPSSDALTGTQDAGKTCSATVQNLSNGSSYFFAVEAEDQTGHHSEKSVVVEAQPKAPVQPDTTAPSIPSSIPGTNASGVPINTRFELTFSEAMNPSSLKLTLAPSVSLAGLAWSAGNTVLRFNPSTDLAGDSNYSLNFSGKDVAGNVLTGANSIGFKTATVKDTTAPATPQNLNAEAAEGQVKLTWKANTEPDLKGYTLLYGKDANNLSSSEGGLFPTPAQA